jgi:hypothetical protein
MTSRSIDDVLPDGSGGLSMQLEFAAEAGEAHDGILAK